MRLSLDLNTATNVIRAYAEGLVTINDYNIRQSVIVTPERLITDWPPQQFNELASSHFQVLVELNPEIVLLGTGKRQQFPSPWLTHSLLSWKHISISAGPFPPCSGRTPGMLRCGWNRLWRCDAMSRRREKTERTRLRAGTQAG